MPSLKVNNSFKNLFSVSKWLKHQVLLGFQEMENLLKTLRPLLFYNVSGIAAYEELEISENAFLTAYQSYISDLRSGKIPAPPRSIFASVMTVDSSMLYAKEVQPGRWMAQLANPVVQLQHHRFFASKVDHKIHPMVMSPESISWGLQFSFPQIFLDSSKGSYMKTSDETLFPNALLFSKLLKWLRAYSVPTTFVWKGVKIRTPIRLGKECFAWINEHPQLCEQGIQVHVY